MDIQIRAYQTFHIGDSRLGPKASFIKGVELNISEIANYKDSLIDIKSNTHINTR